MQHLHEEHKNFLEMAADYVSPTEVSLVSRQAAFPLHLSSHFVRFDYCFGWPNTVSSTAPDLLCTYNIHLQKTVIRLILFTITRVLPA